MANRLRLRITGIEELRHAVKAYGSKLVSGAVADVTDAVEDTVIKAQYLARFKTGKMRNSIKGAVKTDGYSVRGTVSVTATADGFPYPALQEFGSARVSKKPFLVPTAIRNRRRLNAALRSRVIETAPAALGKPRITGEGPGMPGVFID
jgi:hypothetical protein